jgi:hypothetical protein
MLSTSCRYYVRDAFFRYVLFAWIVFICVFFLSNFATDQPHADRSGERADHKGWLFIRYQNWSCRAAIELHGIWAVAPCPQHLLKKKKIIGARICPVYLSEFIVSEKKIDPTILVALTAHYTPNLTSCNGTSYISIESSADQYLLFWVFTWPLK